MSKQNEIQGIIKMMEQYEQGQKSMSKMSNVETVKFQELKPSDPTKTVVQLNTGEVIELEDNSNSVHQLHEKLDKGSGFVLLEDGTRFNVNSIHKLKEPNPSEVEAYKINQATKTVDEEKAEYDELVKHSKEVFEDDSDSGFKQYKDGSFREGDK
ncbi:hypothetical protein JF544_18805 [Halobacillus kuroshimensis]|uniref:Uncharacterized protein n=1 Tax=Halobacillus kuroshimensis TaxID=302481 RepID=A0ABS3E124_9BACI|nr:hypothetical protein [Halobacillus kuroshimensis]MBN8237298.1 hypothetical protein [Halobacillus kuroshimensis]